MENCESSTGGHACHLVKLSKAEYVAQRRESGKQTDRLNDSPCPFIATGATLAHNVILD
jgi:hypothetical protein